MNHSRSIVLYNELFTGDNYKRPNVKDKIANVPCAKDAPVMGSKTMKNFITQNAVENIGSVPRRPAHLTVDTKGGDKQVG